MPPRLDNLLKPGQPLPPDDIMIAKAMDILSLSPHGQKLVTFAEETPVAVLTMATPQATTYLPDPRTGYIGFNRNKPPGPTRFILLLAGLLREAQQEAAGIAHPPLDAPLEKQIETGLAKEEDRLWHLCTIACELDALDMLQGFHFLDELRKMGHTEAVELYLKQAEDTGEDSL